VNDSRFASQALFGTNELLVQVIQVGAADIAQLDALEILPDALSRIEIGSIARQLLQVEPFGRSSFQKGFDLFAPMNGRTIPDRQILPRLLRKSTRRMPTTAAAS
jgi:hypothetical protein